MNYTKFLGAKGQLVLPYLGGPFAEGEGRRVRIDGPRPAIGWTRFEVRGRSARALGAAECPNIGRLAPVRGHHERFTADEAPSGVGSLATCEGGEHLPLVALVASAVARVVQDFIGSGRRREAMVTLGGVTMA